MFAPRTLDPSEFPVVLDEIPEWVLQSLNLDYEGPRQPVRPDEPFVWYLYCVSQVRCLDMREFLGGLLGEPVHIDPMHDYPAYGLGGSSERSSIGTTQPDSYR